MRPLSACLLAAVLAGCAGMAVLPPPPEWETGRLALQNGQHEMAERIFRGILEDPAHARLHPDATLLLARALEGQGELKWALSQYRAFIRYHSEHPDYVTALQAVRQLQSRLRDTREEKAVKVAVLTTFPSVPAVSSMEPWLAELKKSGVDSIILKVYREGTPEMSPGVYFRTAHAPVIRDSLSELLMITRRQGLQVFVWMSVRNMPWKTVEEGEANDQRYDPADPVVRSFG